MPDFGHYETSVYVVQVVTCGGSPVVDICYNICQQPLPINAKPCPILNESNLARAILGLLTPTGGRVIFNNKELTTLSKKQMRRERQHLQMIFQDPLASLNPRLSIGQIVAEPLHNLLMDIQKKHHISLLFIAHDLSIVKHISHHVMVMYQGKVVEHAPCKQLYDRPRHPYTQLLLASVPIPEPVAGRQRLKLINSEKITPIQENITQHGCAFYARCPIAQPQCEHQAPTLKNLDQHVKVACHAATT